VTPFGLSTRDSPNVSLDNNDFVNGWVMVIDPCGLTALESKAIHARLAKAWRSWSLKDRRLLLDVVEAIARPEREPALNLPDVHVMRD
jgi:hypothetical protein